MRVKGFFAAEVIVVLYHRKIQGVSILDHPADVVLFQNGVDLLLFIEKGKVNGTAVVGAAKAHGNAIGNTCQGHQQQKGGYGQGLVLGQHILLYLPRGEGLEPQSPRTFPADACPKKTTQPAV